MANESEAHGQAEKRARQGGAGAGDGARRSAARRPSAPRRMFTVVVCVILVLALGIPTVALAFLHGGA